MSKRKVVFKGLFDLFKGKKVMQHLYHPYEKVISTKLNNWLFHF